MKTREEKLAYQKVWRSENLIKNTTKQRAWVLANKERNRENHSLWATENWKKGNRINP